MILPTSRWRALIWGAGVLAAGVLMQSTGMGRYDDELSCFAGKPAGTVLSLGPKFQEVYSGTLKADDPSGNRDGLCLWTEERREGRLRKRWEWVDDLTHVQATLTDAEGSSRPIYAGFLSQPCEETVKLSESQRLKGIPDGAEVTALGFADEEGNLYGRIYLGAPAEVEAELRAATSRWAWFALALEGVGFVVFSLALLVVIRSPKSQPTAQPA